MKINVITLPQFWQQTSFRFVSSNANVYTSTTSAAGKTLAQMSSPVTSELSLTDSGLIL
jgi:hypothetical protein